MELGDIVLRCTHAILRAHASSGMTRIKQNPPPLKRLAAGDDPLSDLESVVRRLEQTAKENSHLEWKQHPPTGPTVPPRAKYRMVKAAVSFANSDGGFILFGVSPDGNWSGLQDSEIAAADPAHIFELVNGCLFPEIPHINYTTFTRRGRLFAILHVPPSLAAPHVTTREICDRDAAGHVKDTLIHKYAVYTRQGAKSSLATPQHHHQIVERRTRQLHDELVRRVKEVPALSAATTASKPSNVSSTITIIRQTGDPTATPVRLTRSKEGVAGVLLHEEWLMASLMKSTMCLMQIAC
jgi:hypothetical protein